MDANPPQLNFDSSLPLCYPDPTQHTRGSDLAATLQLVASATPSATPLDDAADVLRREAEVCRLIAVNALRTATNFGLLGDLAGANAACAAAVTTIEKMSVSAAAKSLPAAGASGAAAGSAHALSPAHGVRSLLLDMRGQVAEALSREDWFKKWGAHYLRSLMQAHLLQQCNNFRSEVFYLPLHVVRILLTI